MPDAPDERTKDERTGKLRDSPGTSGIPDASTTPPSRPVSPIQLSTDDGDSEVDTTGNGKVQKEKGLDDIFTEEQLDYLYSQKDPYRSATRKQRREIAQSTGSRFLKEAQKAGRYPSKREAAALYSNVAEWFAQRARSRNGPMHWTISWTGRQVFYKENSALIQTTQARLFKDATGITAPIDPSEAPDLDMAEEPEEPASTRKLKPFHFFQRALTAEWNALTEKERESYEKKALVWRERGPTREEKQALAEKETGRVLHQFADEIYRQMGVRLFILVDLEDTSGEHVAFSVDFNGQIDNGVSFKQAEKSYLERIALENHWASFIRRNLPSEDQRPASDEIPGKRPRKRGDPVSVELNDYNEPIVPDITALQNVKKHRLYPNLVRSIMRHDYACAKGIPVNDHESSPPWSLIRGNIRQCIGPEYWPDDWPDGGDPGLYGVKVCEKILLYWFERQKCGQVPFRFHSYWAGEAWASREPPRLAEDSDEEVVVKPKKKRTAKPKAQRKAKKPTSTARQSASAAVPKRRTATGKRVRKAAEEDHDPLPPPPTPSAHRRARPGRNDNTPANDDSSASGKRARKECADSPPPSRPPPERRGRPQRIDDSSASESKSDDSWRSHSSSRSRSVGRRRSTKGKKRSFRPSTSSVSRNDDSDEDDGFALRETPTTRKLIGATQKLSIRTPSRDGSAMDVDEDEHEQGHPDRRARSIRKPNTTSLKREANLGETRYDDEHEGDRRRGREKKVRVRKPGERTSKEREEGEKEEREREAGAAKERKGKGKGQDARERESCGSDSSDDEGRDVEVREHRGHIKERGHSTKKRDRNSGDRAKEDGVPGKEKGKDGKRERENKRNQKGREKGPDQQTDRGRTARKQGDRERTVREQEDREREAEVQRAGDRKRQKRENERTERDEEQRRKKEAQDREDKEDSDNSDEKSDQRRSDVSKREGERRGGGRGRRKTREPRKEDTDDEGSKEIDAQAEREEQEKVRRENLRRERQAEAKERADRRRQSRTKEATESPHPPPSRRRASQRDQPLDDGGDDNADVDSESGVGASGLRRGARVRTQVRDTQERDAEPTRSTARRPTAGEGDIQNTCSRQDRRLLEEASSYLPVSEKRRPKPKKQFGSS